MTTEMSSTEDIIGRKEIDDLEAILAVVGTEESDGRHVVASEYDSIFTWDYEKGARPKLHKLYEKAKNAQWNGETDLPWDTDVDQEKLVVEAAAAQGGHAVGFDISGTPLEKWSEKEWIAFGVENQNWTLSQFLHGEQGALICTAKIVESVPWIDAKYYASTQVMDEARHVEVFAKYLDEKLSGHYPVNAHLRMLLDDIIADSPMGHDLPRHADHDRGPGPGRLRLHALHDRRPAAEAAPALRHGRRGPPRGLRRAEPAGVLRRPLHRRAAGASGVRLRGGRAHA